MTTENRFDKLLTYLEDPSRLNQDEISRIQGALGDLDIDPHRPTAIKLMESGVFNGEWFKQEKGKRGSPFIVNFEHFIAKMAAAIDDHKYELPSRYNKKEYIDRHLPEKISRFQSQLFQLKEELGKIREIKSGFLANTMIKLNKVNEDIRKRLRGYYPKNVRAKIPHHLIENLINIIRDHSPGTNNMLTAKVIAQMLVPFGLTLKLSSIRAKTKNLPQKKRYSFSLP